MRGIALLTSCRATIRAPITVDGTATWRFVYNLLPCPPASQHALIPTTCCDYFARRICVLCYHIPPQCRTNQSTHHTTPTTTSSSRLAVLPPNQLQSLKRSRFPSEARRLLCTGNHSNTKRHLNQNEERQLRLLLRNESQCGMKRSADARSMPCMRAVGSMLSMWVGDDERLALAMGRIHDDLS